MLAWRAAWASLGPACALRRGVADSFLMSYHFHMCQLWYSVYFSNVIYCLVTGWLLSNRQKNAKMNVMSFLINNLVRNRPARASLNSAVRMRDGAMGVSYLLESLVVHKASSILGHLQLPLLYLLAKLPVLIVRHKQERRDMFSLRLTCLQRGRQPRINFFCDIQC